VRRTVVNEAANGSRIKLGDAAAGEVVWALELKGLADSEWNAVEELFEAVEGMLGEFTFLDPFGNLLSWSEDLNATAWRQTSGVTVVDGQEDPLGGFGASLVTNGTSELGRILQSLAVPGWYAYCASVYARSARTGSITLFASTQNASAEKQFGIGPVWQRLEQSVNLASADESVEFGVAIPPGGAVELFGFQVEAQAGPSKYKKTSGRGGVYPAASFGEDELVRTSNGKDDNACRLSIRASA
jgi:hypothetical protein